MTKKEILGMSDNALDKVVKIQGTRFDRKRKVSAKTIEKINYLKACGLTNSAISENLSVSTKVVKYYTDASYRYRDCHKGGTHAHGKKTTQDRAQYKRTLLSSNANVIYPRG